MAIDFTIRTEVSRPQYVVFAFVTDPARLHLWQTNVVEVEAVPPGPLATGSRLREVREVRGRTIAQVVEVAELVEPSVLKLRVVDGSIPVHGDLSFEATDRGTRIELHAFGKPRGATRLLTPLLTAGLKREFAKQYSALKDELEKEAQK